MVDRATLQRVGIDGPGVVIARTDTSASGNIGVRLDYSEFAQAFGGSYGSRLRFVRRPICALTTPGESTCRTATPVVTTNHTGAQTLTADVTVDPATGTTNAQNTTAVGGTLLAVEADTSGSQGDYGATSLSASATWKAGGNAGDFTWTYPMRVPPVPGGLSPQVAINYSSASVDGRTGNTNGQPSWVGEGFDL